MDESVAVAEEPQGEEQEAVEQETIEMVEIPAELHEELRLSTVYRIEAERLYEHAKARASTLKKDLESAQERENRAAEAIVSPSSDPALFTNTGDATEEASADDEAEPSEEPEADA